MGFRSESMIDAPRTVVWDTIEMNWSQAADNQLRHGSHMETQVEIPDLLPEALRRKLGENLIVTVQITELCIHRTLGARIITATDALPYFDLRLQLDDDDDATHAILSGNIDTRGSLRRKASGALITPALGRLATHGIDTFATYITRSQQTLLPEAG